MRTALRVVTSLQLLLSSAQASALDHPSTHGMLVVGKERVYLSHLPMFHSPHDYQVIAEAALPATALAVYRQDMITHPQQRVYTLVPEVFVLPDMIAHPRPFKADLYRGHFERGGQVIAQQITVQLSSVLYFKKFEPQATHSLQLQYFAFGNSSEQFLAHVITAKPDFDQILGVQGMTGELPRMLKMDDLPVQTPLTENPTRREIYHETGELSD